MNCQILFSNFKNFLILNLNMATCWNELEIKALIKYRKETNNVNTPYFITNQSHIAKYFVIIFFYMEIFNEFWVFFQTN